MSRQENPDYFGKSALTPLQGVADAARKVMMGETQEEETEEVPEEGPEEAQAETPKENTEPQKLNEEKKNG